MKPHIFLPLLLIAFFMNSCSKKVAAPTDQGPVTYRIVDKINQPAEKPGKKEKAKMKKEIAKSNRTFFRAVGIETKWTVEISDTNIFFISENKAESFTTPYESPILAVDSNLRLYRSKTKSKAIEITVLENKCGVEEHSNYVKVGIKNASDENFTELKGCGSYLPDPKLNVVWTLRKINDKNVSPSDFGKELPYMDLHVEIDEFTGFAGCNRMKGRLVPFESNGIAFKNVTTTKMMCAPGNQESAFLQALQAVNMYEIKDNVLYLSDGKQTQLVFSKI